MPLKQHCISSVFPLKCREKTIFIWIPLELLVISYIPEDGESAFQKQKCLVFLALRMPTVYQT